MGIGLTIAATTALISVPLWVYDPQTQLVTSQHWDKCKFLAWLTSNLNVVDGADVVIKGLDEDFDIDTAIGIQLDILGVQIGVNRKLNFQPSTSDPTLDDDTYRFVLKAKVAQNQWDGTIIGLYRLWDIVSPASPIKVVDNQDMTCDILFVGQNFTDLQKELIANGYIMPKTQCVTYSYTFGGTFSFRTAVLDGGAYVEEIDVLAGFSDVTQTDGGFLGSVS